MHLFQRTLLQGAHDRLVDAGRMHPLANEKIATEVFDKIASDLGIPAILDRMPNQNEATALGNTLIDYSQKLAANGYGPDQETMQLAKVASQRDPGEKALIVAEYYIQKAAEEGSLRPSEGAGLSAAAMHDLIAEQDLMNRSLGAYDVRQGQTNFAMPGVVGREMGAPGAPTTGAQVKVAEGEPGWMAQQLNKIPQGVRDNTSAFFTDPRTLAEAAQFQAPGVARAREFMGQMSEPHVQSQPISQLQHHQGVLADSARLRNVRIGQGVAGVAALGGAALGARALYRHFNPEKEVQASQKVALDMPDFGAAWESIKGRTKALSAGAHNLAGQAGNAGRLLMTDPRVALQGTRDAMAGIEGLKGMEGLSGYGAELDSLRHRRNVGLGTMGAQAGLGLAGAAGLAYGGKRLYDHFQGSPEDMEVNASEGSAEALAQALHEHGIEPTPELVAALHEAMEAEEGGAPGGEGGGMPPGLDPTKQASEGSLHPTPPGNNLSGAAAHDRVAALDKKNRAPGAFATPQGKTDLSTASGEVGAEKKAELAWRENIIKTAQDWGPHLPAAWPEQTKHAAIQQIASQPPNQRLAYVKQLLQG